MPTRPGSDNGRSASSERARLALAHVARQHRRVMRLESRALAAEASILALRSSLSYRIVNPLRRLAGAVPPDLYRRVRFGHVERRPETDVHGTDSPARPQRRRALLLDDVFPDPERDAGSIEIVNLAEAIRDEGFEVAFLAAHEHALPTPVRTVLERRGIRALGEADGVDTNAYLAAHGAEFDLIVLNRAYAGGRFFEDARRTAPAAIVLFNTIDLHWLRVEREAALTGRPELLVASEDLKRRETHLARHCDAVLVVSDTERQALEAEVDDALVLALPLARSVTPPVRSFGERDGIGFVGSFKHRPNVDGLDWFVRDVWPIVERRRPGLRLSVAGADRPVELLDGVPGRIEPVGHVVDLGAWLETLRLTIAPLRYGAGVKGKVISSLAAGVPCVGTPVAFEGTNFGEGYCVETATDPDQFAEHVIGVHDDEEHWARLSREALAEIASDYAIAAWRAKLHDLLWVLGLVSTRPALPSVAIG